MNNERKHKITNELLKVSKSQIFEEALKEFIYEDEWNKDHSHMPFMVYGRPLLINGRKIIKKRCLCHGLLTKTMIALYNKHTGTAIMVGKDCAKLFPSFNENNTKITSDIYELRTSAKRRYDNKEIDFDIFRNINDALDIIEACREKRRMVAKIKAICQKVTEKIGSNIFDFGKYNGKPVLWVVNNHPRYTRFILSNKFKPIRRTFNTKEYMFCD
jgi:hypothetical protein